MSVIIETSGGVITLLRFDRDAPTQPSCVLAQPALEIDQVGDTSAILHQGITNLVSRIAALKREGKPWFPSSLCCKVFRNHLEVVVKMRCFRCTRMGIQVPKSENM